jgi:polyhydroxybutyrate depolymerase
MINKYLKNILAATFLLLLFMALRIRIGPQASQSFMKPGTHHLELRSQGHKWQYVVYIPRQYDSTQATPLVLILHGFGGTGQFYLDRAGWRAKADEAGFIAVAPNGLPARPQLPKRTRVWNTGDLAPNNPRSNIDDVRFLRSLLDELQDRLKIDEHRIYVTGHSNGGAMTFLLGIELSERLTAIAPVATPFEFKNRNPVRPIPTLYIIGTKDPLVPFAGGETELPWGQRRRTLPVRNFLQDWAKVLGCASSPQPLENNDVFEVVRYNSCKRNVKFMAYFIKGQGHAWPGGQSASPEWVVGPSINQFKATDVIWDFFREQTN